MTQQTAIYKWMAFTRFNTGKKCTYISERPGTRTRQPVKILRLLRKGHT